MGNYEQLKQAVSDVIKKNGNQEITGEIMQNTLLSIISTVGNDATFAGIAVPETNPGTPDQNVFYIASQPGNYSNFGSIKLVDQVLILTNKNGYWVKFDAGITTAAKVAELEERSNANSAYIKLTLQYIGVDMPYMIEVGKKYKVLSDEQSTYLDARDRYYDSETQLCIFKTDFRLEQIQQRWSNVKVCLNYYNSAGGSMQAFDMIVFSHEWNFMQFASDAETIFAWALDKGYRFDFPMNVLLK